MNEVKIQIPDNCELIKDGNTYIVKEKKQTLPRSWEEFCERYPIKEGEAFIDLESTISVADHKHNRHVSTSRDWCTSKEEAKAFLALMQLRQLRKAWVGEWKTPTNADHGVIYPLRGSLSTSINRASSRVLSFPTEAMAKDFLNCFRDLCETAKILL